MASVEGPGYTYIIYVTWLVMSIRRPQVLEFKKFELFDILCIFNCTSTSNKESNG